MCAVLRCGIDYLIFESKKTSLALIRAPMKRSWGKSRADDEVQERAGGVENHRKCKSMGGK